jgi:glutathione S-transferase
MANIKYQSEYSPLKRSPKGKFPWITFNGEVISDSEFVLEFLKKQFNQDFSAHLSPVEKSTARAYLKMLEESTKWYAIAEQIGLI